MAFPDRLKQLRTERPITQAGLANAISLHERSIRGYELGTAQPTLPVLIALAQYFSCSVDYLLGLSETRERQP